ncbi:MAG: sulfite oxidase [Gemmatimonadales bacterium]
MISNNRRLIHDPEGFNSATWPLRQDQLITPTDQFFTRSHAATPQVDPTSYRLEIDGLVERTATLSLAELAEFPRREISATLVCAGLRREEYLALGPLPGELPWGPEAVSTGRWSGIALSDVLRAAHVAAGARYVQFTGLDCVERQGRRFGFGGSIDRAKADDVLLASELNGAPLPPDHGFPLRAVVPGWIGARSVKWLGRITLAAEPSDNYFQSKAYRVQRTPDPSDPRDVSAGTALSEVPLNAVILEPQRDHLVPAGAARLRGWAMGSAGCAITSVEVSPNGGTDWIPATIERPGERWTWSLWEATLRLPRGRHVLAVRAADASGATMPPGVAGSWNVKGYANNAWHRVTVQAE